MPEPLTFNLRDRLAGYQHAFDSHNVALDPQLIFRATFDPEGGRQAVDQIVKTDATAIIAINDDVAAVFTAGCMSIISGFQRTTR